MTRTRKEQKKLDLVITAAELDGWHITSDGDGFEIEQESPAGEDFGFYVYADTAEELRDEIRDYYESFDAEAHAASWYGQNGAPGLRELVEDAEEIEAMLENLAIIAAQALAFCDDMKGGANR